MRDPLDQWAEDGTYGAFQGDSPGHTAELAGEWQDYSHPADASTHGWTEPGQSSVVSGPVHVVGPMWRDEDLHTFPDHHAFPEHHAFPDHQGFPAHHGPPRQQHDSWDGVQALPGEGPLFSAQVQAQPPATPVHIPATEPGGTGGGGMLPGEEFASRLKAPEPRHSPNRRRPLRRTAIALLTVVLVVSGGTFAWAETKLQRDVDLDHYGSRPPAGKGTTYLIVGSDSREGLSAEDRKNLHTGVFGGRRTDSMILMHKGSNGTTMVSLPRDSWVTIPGYTRPSTGKRSAPVKNKLNAAFSQGGPELLISTIEQNTGVRIDHYAEIGFAGFVNIVDAVGGVPMCIKRDIRDEDSGADLRKGCQTLDGAQALAFVRQRHQEAKGDLGRTQNQQRFLSALAHKAASPGTVLDPSDLYPALSAGLDTLIVDEGMGMQALTKMFRSLQGVSNGAGKQVNVPTAGGLSTSKGSAVRWNEAQAKKLFKELREDRPVTVRGK